MATKKTKKKKTYTTMTSIKKKYQNEKIAAGSKLNQVTKAISHNNQLLKATNKDLKTAKGSTKTRLTKLASNLNKTKKTLDKKKKSLTTKYDKAKTNAARYKHSREASALRKKKILTKMKKSKYWGERAYIMPKYPWSTSSYVFIRVNDEAPAFNTTVASNSAEKGKTNASNPQAQPTTISIQGVLGGDGANSHMKGLKQQAKRLERWSKNGTELTWHGDHNLASTSITDFTPDFSHEIGTGGENIINITLTLTQTEYADSNTKNKKKAKKDTGNKQKKKKSTKKPKKRYVVTKRGWTYYYISKKTKTPIKTLEKKNKYKPRAIPIGVKIYY